MLFRPQKIAVLEDGAVMAADAVTVELYATTGGFGSLGELLARNRTPLRTVDLDVLDARERRPTTGSATSASILSISLNRGRRRWRRSPRAASAGCAHFLAVEVKIAPQRESTTRAGCGTWGSTRRRARC